MIRAKLIMIVVRFLMGAIALGVGIWYLSSSIGGAALTYSSMDNFMTAIGANGDVATVNGCFLCGYISDLFGVIGRATAMFWDAIVSSLWIIMSIGFGVFIIVDGGKYIYDATKKTASLDGGEKKLDIEPWLNKVWKSGMRVLIAGVMIGALGMGGNTALKTVANITITPVMYVGAELSMAATGINNSASCGVGAMADTESDDDILNPILQPFMCVMGNLNSVMLAGAAGGFALMNYAWLGMGGGIFTWIAGLAMVLMFLVIGFNLFFQVLSVIFKLVFIIIFMPLFIAAAGFETMWKAASNLFTRAIDTVVKAAIQIVGITLKILILYATVSYVADEFFPGPADGYSAILPPLMGQTIQNPDARTMSVMNAFVECEKVSITDGEMDADKFKTCFIQQKNTIEEKYPGAFDFLGDGWGFLMMMIGLFLLYYYVVAPRVDKMLSIAGAKSDFDFGGQIKQLGKNIWDVPVQLTEKITKAVGKK